MTKQEMYSKFMNTNLPFGEKYESLLISKIEKIFESDFLDDNKTKTHDIKLENGTLIEVKTHTPDDKEFIKYSYRINFEYAQLMTPSGFLTSNSHYYVVYYPNIVNDDNLFIIETQKLVNLFNILYPNGISDTKPKHKYLNSVLQYGDRYWSKLGICLRGGDNNYFKLLLINSKIENFFYHKEKYII